MKIKMLHQAIHAVLIHFKCELGTGMVPPMTTERLVQKDLNQLMKKNGRKYGLHT